ncbi:MAG: response regulator [Armatimonadetes bacterium]|nr:response regulator [Armatimonadota bacterium]
MASIGDGHARLGPATRLAGCIVLASLLCALAWWVGGVRAMALDHSMRESLVQRAVGTANTVNQRLVSRLTFTIADLGTTADERLREQLTAAAEEGSQQGIYMVRARGGHFHFGPETYQRTDPLASAPGDEYKKPPAELTAVFEDLRPRTAGPYTDEYGTFVSVFAPVVDAARGSAAAVVGIDVLAADWGSRLAAERLRPLLAVGALLVLLALAGVAVGLRGLRHKSAAPRLRGWVVAPTLAAMLAALAVYGVDRYGQFTEASRADAVQFRQHAQDVWTRGIASRALLLRAHADRLAQDAGLLTAWRRRDLPALSGRANGLWRRLKAEYGVTHLTLIDPDRVAIFRAHDPARRGDRIDRSTLLTAQRTGEDAWGVEPGTFGAITFRYVRPCFDADTRLGSIEVGLQLDQTLNHLARDLQADLLIALRKRNLPREAVESVRRALRADQRWSEFPDFAVISPSAVALPPGLSRWFSGHHSRDTLVPSLQTDSSGRQVACGAIGVHDGADRVVADLIVLRDMTVQAHAARASLAMSLATALVVLGGVLLLLWSVTGQAESRLDALIAELRESESRTRAITGSAQEAILMMDPQGCISYWNPAAERVLGYTAGEALGRSLHALLTPERFRPAHEAAYPEFLKTGEGAAVGRTLDLAAIRKDGLEIDIRLSLSAIYLDGGWHAVGILSDITERLRAERQLIEANSRLARASEEAKALAEQASQASRAKSEFLANMSHEIRTPMNGIIGMTGLLLDTELTPDQRQYTQIVRSSGDTLLALINDILDFSKIEAGKLELEVLSFDLRTTLEDAVEILAVKAQQKGLDIVCMVDANVPEWVRGDAGRLRQIAVNLCANAVKFTDTGSVTLHASVASEDERSITVRFSVTDTGIGVAPNKLPILFAAFTQADGSTTRKYGGTGLGLAISKQLAELMGGSIGVESEPNRGSTFWFTAVLGKDASRKDHAAMSSMALEGVRVLVVDDNDVNLLLVTTLLRTWGCEQASAKDGEGALQILHEAAAAGRPFRMALLDMHMPGMDGEQLAAAISQSAAIRATLLVMLTSMADGGAAVRLAAYGVARCMTKPVRQSVLKTCLLDVLDQRESHEKSAGPVVGRTRAIDAGPVARILVAEDNPTNQLVALMVLRKLGFQADAVANGFEALSALRAVPYGLVLMDCQMPEMDGFEAARRIRDPKSQGLDHTIPIVAMTAAAMQGDREACLEAGMDDYVSKPVKSDDLYAVIQKWLGKQTTGA